MREYISSLKAVSTQSSSNTGASKANLKLQNKSFFSFFFLYINPQEICERFNGHNAQVSADHPQPSFKKENAKVLDAVVKISVAHLFELQHSSWKPSQPISALISELNNRGPLVIGGYFGRSSYSEDPFVMKEKIAEHSICAWAPGTKIKSHVIAHTITVIGAKKCGDKGLIYYVDPLDPSDPQDITAQKIYAISYRSLTENSFTLQGTKEVLTNAVYALAAPTPPKAAE